MGSGCPREHALIVKLLAGVILEDGIEAEAA